MAEMTTITLMHKPLSSVNSPYRNKEAVSNHLDPNHKNLKSDYATQQISSPVPVPVPFNHKYDPTYQRLNSTMFCETHSAVPDVSHLPFLNIYWKQPEISSTI